ncbi:hypothetical protein, partial [Acetobacter orientalis]|uniref:hypothetical protein n=1 Tax=Acetobacter orientalis TaxID=146474 RepID=UPI0039EC145C
RRAVHALVSIFLLAAERFPTKAVSWGAVLLCVSYVALHVCGHRELSFWFNVSSIKARVVIKLSRDCVFFVTQQ